MSYWYIGVLVYWCIGEMIFAGIYFRFYENALHRSAPKLLVTSYSLLVSNIRFLISHSSFLISFLNSKGVQK